MFKKILSLLKNIFHNRFEEAVAISSSSIIVIAIAMDKIMFLQACPLCILTRYVFALLAISALIGILVKQKIIGRLLIAISSILGILVTSRQIYIQNLSSEGLTNLSGCGMPLETTIEFYGFFGGIYKTLQGGPSCAEEGWRFIFNFAEWGLIFFLIFIFVNLLNVFKVLKKV